jgi:hypothetical protein
LPAIGRNPRWGWRAHLFRRRPQRLLDGPRNLTEALFLSISQTTSAGFTGNLNSCSPASFVTITDAAKMAFVPCASILFAGF